MLGIVGVAIAGLFGLTGLPAVSGLFGSLCAKEDLIGLVRREPRQRIKGSREDLAARKRRVASEWIAVSE